MINKYAFLIIGMIFLVSQVNASLTDNLVSHYKLDENSGNIASDDLNYLNMTAYGTPSWTTGKLNNSFHADSLGDSLNATITRNLSTSYSISLWGKLSSGFPLSDFIFTSPDQLNLRVLANGTPQLIIATPTWQTFGSNQTIYPDEWVLYTLTYNGSNYKGQLFINNNLVIDSTYNSGYVANNVSLNFPRSGAGWSDGYLDEIRIWNRVLSYLEVIELYNQDNGHLINQIYPVDNFVVYETNNTDLTLSCNVSVNSDKEIKNISIIENSTGLFVETSVDLSSQSLTEYMINKTISVGENVGNIYWSCFAFDNNSEFFTSQNRTINVTPLLFGLCNATLTNKLLNITFKDESSFSTINATISSSIFDYYLGDGSIYKTFSLTNNTGSYDYAFCSNYNLDEVYVNPRIQYASIDYPQRVYDPNTLMLTNSSVMNKTLYLLTTEDGLYVTFQVLNSADQPIEDVEVIASREISGSDYNVSYGTTSSAGTTTLWLNPDFVHDFIFSKAGYTTLITSLQPTNTEYTVVLGSSSTSTEFDYSRGISYKILPILGTLNSSTNYTFNFTISSTYWNLDEYGFNLYDSLGNLLTSQTDTIQEGGSVYQSINTSNYSYIKMNFYYLINETYNNFSVYWVAYDFSGTDFSIWAWFNDLSEYLTTGEGIFGLVKSDENNFTLDLIIYLFILFSVGIASYNYSITTPSVVLGILFGLVFLFDVILDLLSNPINAVPNFPTIFVGIVLIIELIREGTR